MKIVRLIIPLLLATLTTSVQAETINCTPVTSLPATIDTQGLYCLTGNLSTSQSSGHAIEITANNVTLDLNGWKIGGQAAGTGTNAWGIYSAAVNVTVKNGIVRGFARAVDLTGRGATVQGITADQNTVVGIYVEGPGSVIQGNQVVDSGGSTLGPNLNAFGMNVTGSGSLVQNNLVSGITSTGSGNEFGIVFGNSATQSAARGNIVSDPARPTGGGSSYGIYISSTSGVAVSNNIVTNFTYGVNYGGGTGTYSRNTVISCDTPYLGGTTGSGND